MATKSLIDVMDQVNQSKSMLDALYPIVEDNGLGLILQHIHDRLALAAADLDSLILKE